MRSVVLALVLLAPLAAAQSEGRVVEHGSWSQFEPAWREGPASITFQGREIEVPFGARYATDGATWIYAADEPPPARPGVPPHCTEFPANGTWVLVKDGTCAFAPHPSVACEGTHVCADARGEPRPPPATASPTPLSQLMDTCGNPALKCTPVPPALAAAALTLAVVVRRLSGPSCGRGRA